MTIELRDILWNLALGISFLLMMGKSGCYGDHHQRKQEHNTSFITKGEKR